MGIVSHCIRIGLGLGIRSGFGEGWLYVALIWAVVGGFWVWFGLGYLLFGALLLARC